jgi:hypothetical protein
MTLQARLHFNRQTQSNLAGLIAQFNSDTEAREVVLQQYLTLVAEASEIERQLLAV